MAYVKKTWVNGEILDADKMNHLEQGVYDNSVEKANVDGSYPDLTAGLADNLDTTVGTNDSVPYNFRTSGGTIDTGNKERVDAIVGGTVAWNQLIKNGNFESTNNWRVYTPANGQLSVSENVSTITYLVASTGGGYSFGLTYTGGLQLQTEHKYMIKADANPDFDTQLTFELGTSIDRNFSVSTNSWTELSIVEMRPSWSNVNTFIIKPQHASIAVGSTLKVRNVQLIDLTLLLGSTIADYIYALERSNAGAGVAYFRKLFPKPYYEYNAGELMSVKTSAHKMVGFNAYNPTTGTAKVVGGNQYQITGAYSALSLDGTAITPDANGKFTPSASGTLTVTGGNSTDTCVHLVWDGERNGEYEPYQEWNYALDSDLELRGIPKLDANNKLYYDGDTYESDGTVTRKYGIVDLGTLTWKQNGENKVYAPVSGKAVGSQNVLANGFVTIPSSTDTGVMTSGKLKPYSTGTSITLCLTGITSTNASTMLSGIYLVYELATPTTETADPYQQTQNVSDWGTEEYVDSRTVPIPVGHNTFYPENLKRKLQNLPSDFSTLIARTESGFIATNAYVTNEFLIINNQLYKTTASIANGATITPNTNVVATTIGEVLTAILNS